MISNQPEDLPFNPLNGESNETTLARLAKESLNQSRVNTSALFGPGQARARAGAAATPHNNPYSTIVANQARPAQQALLEQMRAQAAGPSLAAMQGSRAQGQNLQAALGAGGRGAMLQAGQVGSGLASDTGMGRLAEQLQASQGTGGLAGNVRGSDLSVAGQQSQFGLQQRGLDDALRQFYANQGVALQDAGYGLRREQDKLDAATKLRLQQKLLDEQNNTVDKTLQVGGTIAGLFL